MSQSVLCDVYFTWNYEKGKENQFWLFWKSLLKTELILLQTIVPNFISKCILYYTPACFMTVDHVLYVFSKILFYVFGSTMVLF